MFYKALDCLSNNNKKCWLDFKKSAYVFFNDKTAYLYQREKLVKKKTTQFLRCFCTSVMFPGKFRLCKDERFLLYDYNKAKCSFLFEISQNKVSSLEKDVKKH